MEKVGLVRGGVLTLPPGFRFHPTDEELVLQYLKRKVFCCPLPAAIIPEIQLSMHDPWDLPGGAEGERYFFSPREARRPKGRASAAGYWKAVGRERRVVASGGNQVVGMKRTLVFCLGKAPNGSRTDWVMHEYRLAGDGAGPCVPPQRKTSTHQVEDWVLCRVFKKRRPEGNGSSTARRSHYFAATPSDSESSCLTEATDDEYGSEQKSSGRSNASSSPRGTEP